VWRKKRKPSDRDDQQEVSLFPWRLTAKLVKSCSCLFMWITYNHPLFNHLNNTKWRAKITKMQVGLCNLE
jgi:hypothetical protein